MFTDSKYSKCYDAIIAKARLRRVQTGYTEKHHAHPRSLGGGSGYNLVKLTPREHFICHWLLIRMMPYDYLKAKMTNSLRMMRDHSNKIECYSAPITKLVYKNL